MSVWNVLDAQKDSHQHSYLITHVSVADRPRSLYRMAVVTVGSSHLVSHH